MQRRKRIVHETPDPYLALPPEPSARSKTVSPDQVDCSQSAAEKKGRSRQKGRKRKKRCFLPGAVLFVLLLLAGGGIKRPGTQETTAWPERSTESAENAGLETGGSGLADAGADSGSADAQTYGDDYDYSMQDALRGAAQTADTDAGILMLVNKTFALPDDYEPTLHWLSNGSCAVAEEMYDSLAAMLSDGTDEGLEFVVASGYRSIQEQKALLEEDIQADMENEGLTYEEAYEKETKETMPPGCSEHETGLAVDLVALSYQMLDSGQAQTAENQWLREHCSEYGFILRYPEGKEEITGVNYESWHFRYVGNEAAEEITRRGITLEEYLEA